MVTKVDARVLGLSSDMRAKSDGTLGTSVEGWLDFNIPSGVSSFSIPLNSNYDEFEFTFQNVLVGTNNTVFTMKFNYGSGPVTTGTTRRHIVGAGSNGFGSIRASNDGTIVLNLNNDSTGIRNTRGWITNRSGVAKNVIAAFVWNEPSTDSLIVYSGNDASTGKAQSVDVALSLGTFSSGLVRVRAIKKAD